MGMNLSLLKKSSKITHKEALDFLSENGFEEAIGIYKEKVQKNKVVLSQLYRSNTFKRNKRKNSEYSHQYNYCLEDTHTMRVVNVGNLVAKRLENNKRGTLLPKDERISKIDRSKKLEYVGGNIWA